MDKPYARIQGPFAAPFVEMPDIVIAALSSAGWTKFQYFENPNCLQAQYADQETWGGKKFTASFSAEVVWRKDSDPPAEFDAIKTELLAADALLVEIRLKHHDSSDQGKAKGKLEQLWTELVERSKESAKALPNKARPTEHGSARWATMEELIEEKYIVKPDGDLSRRFLIGKVDGQTLAVPKRQAEAHTIVAGPPGSGKSRTMIIPNLIERTNTSAIVTEVTAGDDMVPTVYAATAGYRHRKGHQIYYFNPSDLQNCTRFNPIDFIENVSDAIKIATLIVLNTTAKTHVGDQIWSQSEQHLLTSLLLYASGRRGRKSKSVEGGEANLGYVRSMLSLGPENLEKLITETGTQESHVRFSEFIKNSSPNFRLGVFSGLIQRLNPWDDPQICALTEVTDFDPEVMQNELFTFYLSYPVHRHEYKPIMALAINFLLLFPLQKKFDKPLAMLLDEFAAYGHIPRIDLIQAVVRNRELPMVFGFQDLQQLTKAYSREDAEIIFTNTDTKVMFATGSPKTQQLVSELLGRTTKEKKTISSSGQINRTTFGDPLLAPSEIGRIPDGKVLVIRNKRYPILAETISPGHYQSFFTDYPPPEKPPRSIRVDIQKKCEMVKILKFDEAKAEAQTARYVEELKKKQDAQAAPDTQTPPDLTQRDGPVQSPDPALNDCDPNNPYYVFDSDPNEKYYDSDNSQ